MPRSTTRYFHPNQISPNIVSLWSRWKQAQVGTLSIIMDRTFTSGYSCTVADSSGSVSLSIIMSIWHVWHDPRCDHRDLIFTIVMSMIFAWWSSPETEKMMSLLLICAGAATREDDLVSSGALLLFCGVTLRVTAWVSRDDVSRVVDRGMSVWLRDRVRRGTSCVMAGETSRVTVFDRCEVAVNVGSRSAVVWRVLVTLFRGTLSITSSSVTSDNVTFDTAADRVSDDLVSVFLAVTSLDDLVRLIVVFVFVDGVVDTGGWLDMISTSDWGSYMTSSVWV